MKCSDSGQSHIWTFWHLVPSILTYRLDLPFKESFINKPWTLVFRSTIAVGFSTINSDFNSKHEPFFVASLYFPANFQLMDNCWFGLVVWDSKGTPKQQSISFSGIPGIQTTNPNQQPTISWLNHCRVLKGGGCSTGGGNWGTLRIPREDWGTLQNIRED